jgi:hypothetical protein
VADAEGGPWKGIQKLAVVPPEPLELLLEEELLDAPLEEEEELLEDPLELELLEEEAPEEEELLDVEPDEEAPDEEELLPDDELLEDELLEEDPLDDEPPDDEDGGWPPDESPPQAARAAVMASRVTTAHDEAPRVIADLVREFIVLVVSLVATALLRRLGRLAGMCVRQTQRL